MSLDLNELLRARGAEKYGLFERYLNGQLVRVLKTIGFDVDYVRGEGAYLYDREGRKYLDHLSGFGVFAMGRNHPSVAAALRQVLDGQLAGMVQLDVSPLAGLLGERLNGFMPWLDKYYFCNSGAEAVEAALKFARCATGRRRIVYCSHGYHGLTYGALSVTADALYREGFEPLLPDCVEVPFNDLVSLERELARGEVAAFIVEPIQGKGVNLPRGDYLAEAARLCRKHGALFIADEIQCGLGRSGRFLACEHWGVEPDIVTLAKALSGGFVPLGAVACRRAVFDRVFDRMDRAVVHGSTFSKNDMAMTAGLAALTVLEEEGLIARAEARGEALMAALRDRLATMEFVKEVRGKGLMIGLELGAPRSLKLKAAYAMIERARKGLFCQLLLIPLLKDHRILAQVAGSELPVIKLLPALVIEEADIEWTVGAFEAVLRQAHSLGGVWDLGRTLAGHALKARAGDPEAKVG
ncbi:MAG: aspartate aminotransferase family protein [Kiloniellales bacterium]|nr:aspartate aminotransferase family protein [Kiloniellales bacterium]